MQPLFFLFNIVDTFFPLTLRWASQDIHCQVKGWIGKFRGPFSPYLVLQWQGIYSETHASTGVIVLHLKSVTNTARQQDLMIH